jgi:hypothetical protein
MGVEAIGLGEQLTIKIKPMAINTPCAFDLLQCCMASAFPQKSR